MNEIVAKFISDCKNSGKTFVALNQVPYEVIKELARRHEPALVDSLKERVNRVKEKLEHIKHNIQLNKDFKTVKNDIEEALAYMGNWEWVCGDVLDKAASLDHLPAMKELADVCLNNEQLRHYQAILYLDGASTLEEDETRCRCASRRRWCSAALSGSTTAGGTTFSISARPRRPTLTPSGWPRRYTSFSTMSGHGLNSKDMTNITNTSDSLDGCKYNVGDVVIFNSFFDEGSFEMLVCKITATYEDSLKYDLVAVDGGRIFDRVNEADIYRDKYSLHVLFNDAVEFLLSEMGNPRYFKE